MRTPNDKIKQIGQVHSKRAGHERKESPLLMGLGIAAVFAVIWIGLVYHYG